MFNILYCSTVIEKQRWAQLLVPAVYIFWSALSKKEWIWLFKNFKPHFSDKFKLMEYLTSVECCLNCECPHTCAYDMSCVETFHYPVANYL